MKFLDTINSPADLRKLPIDALPHLAREIREFMIDIVSKTGGHLAPSLGAVELAIVLHYVYNTPEDKLVWDVGHQAYAHKILTGRRASFHTLRQFGGISAADSGIRTGGGQHTGIGLRIAAVGPDDESSEQR